MNSDMQKALVNLIDETLGEIEELKKSDRFSASEVELGDSKSGIKDADKDGKLDKEEDKKDEEKEDDDKDEDKKEDKDMDKAEGKNSEADPNAGNHKIVKDEDGDMDKAEGKNRESDPMSKMEERMDKFEGMMSKMESFLSKMEDVEKKEDDDKEDKDDKKDDDDKDMKKSISTGRVGRISFDTETLEKSTSDRIDGLEKSLEGISDMLKDLADAPVPAKSVSYKNVQPLKKSEDAVEPLSKSDLVEKLFELKKSGTSVDSLDITSAELGSPNELVKIANKYNIN